MKTSEGKWGKAGVVAGWGRQDLIASLEVLHLMLPYLEFSRDYI